MHEALIQTLERLDSDDEDVQGRAIEQIAVLLQKNRVVHASEDPYYAQILSPDLFAIKLTRDEQREIVQRLSTLIKSDRYHPSLLWPLGQARPTVGIRPLLEIIEDCSDKFDQHASDQAILDLENFLATRRGRLIPYIARQILKHNPIPFLERMSESEDPELARYGKRVLYKLIRLLRKESATFAASYAELAYSGTNAPEPISIMMRMLECAFQNDIKPEDYYPLLAVLGDRAAQGGMDMAIALFSRVRYSQVVEDVGRVTTTDVPDPQSVEQVRQRLLACGYEEWLAQNEA